MKPRTCDRSGETLDNDFGQVQIISRDSKLSEDGKIIASYDLTPDLTKQVSILIKAFMQKKISVTESPGGLSVRIQTPDSDYISFLFKKEEG